MPTFRISASGGCTWRAPIISAASAASSIFAPTDLLVDTGSAQTLLEAEAEILAHMNEDHADAIQLYATALMGARPGAWRMAGIDPEGCDLILDGTGAADCLRVAHRLAGPSPQGARPLGGGSAARAGTA